MSELIEFDNEQKKIIRDQFFPPAATNEDMIYCMGVAKALGLNPILKEIYFVERKSQVNGQWVSKIEPLAGKNAFLKLAHMSGKFGGIETLTYLSETPKLIDGKWTVSSELMAKAIVTRSDFEMPFIVEVAYSEYVQKKRDGTPTKFWAEKPLTMLKKVASSQALREAFMVSGLYDESEIDDNTNEEYKMPEGSMIKPTPKRTRRTRAQIEAELRAEEAEIVEVTEIDEKDIPV